MRALPAPYGWESAGTIVHVQLSREGGPGPIMRYRVWQALLDHSCWPPIIPRVLSCLEHGVYQCTMREYVVREVVRHGHLASAGVRFTILGRVHNGTYRGTHDGTEAPQNTPFPTGPSRPNVGPVGVI
jgi:hypothetical protein